MKDRELDVIYDFVDMYMSLGKVDFINKFLKTLYRDIHNLSIDEVLTWLIVCFPARDRLTEYGVLLRAAKQTFKKDDESGQLFIGL